VTDLGEEKQKAVTPRDVTLLVRESSGEFVVVEFDQRSRRNQYARMRETGARMTDGLRAQPSLTPMPPRPAPGMLLPPRPRGRPS